MGQKPVIHGNDHRPASWNAATDPGGADPMDWLLTGGGFIRFDIDNIGDWLDVETSTNSPHGYGLRFTDTSAAGMHFAPTADFLVDAGRVILNADGGNSSLQAVAGEASVSSDIDVRLTATSGELHTISSGVHMEATGGSFFVEANNVDNQTIAFSISPVGGTFAIINLPTSAPAVANSVWNSGGTLKIV